MLEMMKTTQFKKDCRRMEKRRSDMTRLDAVIEMLRRGETLPEKYDDHKLHGKDNNCRECHIEPNWLLKYMIDDEGLVLVALRTGSHSDLKFG